MLDPSYQDTAKNNADADDDEMPAGESRYSIVIATAKRARELIAGEEAAVPSYGKKPLSVAIEELHRGKIKIQDPDESDNDAVNGENAEETAEDASASATADVSDAKSESAEESGSGESPAGTETEG